MDVTINIDPDAIQSIATAVVCVFVLLSVAIAGIVATLKGRDVL